MSQQPIPCTSCGERPAVVRQQVVQTRIKPQEGGPVFGFRGFEVLLCVECHEQRYEPEGFRGEPNPTCPQLLIELGATVHNHNHHAGHGVRESIEEWRWAHPGCLDAPDTKVTDRQIQEVMDREDN